MELIILFAPLIGAILSGFGHHYIGEKIAIYTATSLLFVAAIFSWIVFLTFNGSTEIIQILSFIQSGDFVSNWSIRIDRLTTIMLIV